MEIIDWLDTQGTKEHHKARDLIESLRAELEAVKKERDRLIQSDCSTCAGRDIGKLAIQLAECEQERDELVAAAKNLIRVKGRHNTEQAYRTLETAIAKLGADKGEL